MDDGALAQFVSITGTKPETARQYLGFTDGDVQQAIELFFANEGADLEATPASNPPAPSYPPPVPDPSTRPPANQRDIVRIDSDSDSDLLEYSSQPTSGPGARPPASAARTGSALHTLSESAPPIHQAASRVDEDEAFAHRLQQEMYGEAGVETTGDPEVVRAPIARTTETLIGPDSFDPNDPQEMNAAVLQQIRARQRPRPRGVWIAKFSDCVVDMLNENKIVQVYSINPLRLRFGIEPTQAPTMIVLDLLELPLGLQRRRPSRRVSPRCIGLRTN